MILKFPQPYPDETFYSWIARYHERSANYFASNTLESIYNSRTGCAIYGLPTGLQIFCDQLQPLISYKLEDIILHHTSLPYYSSSLPKKRIQAASEKMSGTLNSDVQGILGALGSTVKEFRYLRYCENCVEEDIKHYGEPYWHRTHQLPGVLVCPHHHSPTLNSVVDKQHLKSPLYISAARSAKLNVLQKKVFTDPRLIKIAHESHRLVSKFHRPVTSARYRPDIIRLGFNKGSVINQGKLGDAFSSYWDEPLLKHLGVMVDFNSESSWLKFMTRRTRGGLQSHPLQHILFRLFLKQKRSEQSTVVPKAKFNESHQCPNKFCTEPDENSAKVHKTYKYNKSGPTYAEISCPCGFCFTSRIDGKNLYTSNVTNFGNAWEKQFIEYVNEGHSIHKLEQLMSVTRPVIKKKVVELGLSPKWLSQIKKKKPSQFMEKRAKQHKKRYLRYRQKYPNATDKELRKKILSSIKFLLRYERDWFDSHKPKTKMPSKKTLVNWDERDSYYLKEAQNIISELLKMPGKPQRITPSLISKIMGEKNIFSKIPEKIPKTMTFLAEACNRDDFIVRRFHWAAKQLFQQGKPITRNRIIKKAAVRYTVSAIHETLLEELVNNEATHQLPENGPPST